MTSTNPKVIPPPPSKRKIDMDGDMMFTKSPYTTKGTFAAKIILSILMSVLLYSLFVVMFFFYGTARSLHDTAVSMIQQTIKEVSQDLQLTLPTNVIEQITQTVNSVVIPPNFFADKDVQKSNIAVIRKATLGFCITSFLLIVVVLAVYFGMRATAHKPNKNPAMAYPGRAYPDMVPILVSSSLSFAVLVVCQITFMYGVTSRFLPVDRNQIRLLIVNQLLEYTSRI